MTSKALPGEQMHAPIRVKRTSGSLPVTAHGLEPMSLPTIATLLPTLIMAPRAIAPSPPSTRELPLLAPCIHVMWPPAPPSTWHSPSRLAPISQSLIRAACSLAGPHPGNAAACGGSCQQLLCSSSCCAPAAACPGGQASAGV